MVTQWLLIVMLFGSSSFNASTVQTHRLVTLKDCERVGNVYHDLSAIKGREIRWACVEVTK